MPDRPKARLAWVLLSALWFVLTAGSIAAVEPADSPLAPPDTSSPRATLKSFNDAVSGAYRSFRDSHAYTRDIPEVRDHLRRAVRTLDLSKVPPALTRDVGTEAALLLKEVLDRIELPAPDDIPGDASSQAGDATSQPEDAGSQPGDASSQLPTKWILPGTEITLEKVADGPRAGEYLFTPETVAHAREFYERIKNLPYKAGAAQDFYHLYQFSPGWMVPRIFMQAMPASLRVPHFGQALWQWVALALLLLAGAGLFGLIFIWQSRRFGIFGNHPLCMITPLAGMAIAKGLAYLIDQQIGIAGEFLLSLQLALDVLFYVFLVILVIALSNISLHLILSAGRFRRRGINRPLVRVCLRIVMLGLIAAVLVAATNSLGLPLTAVIAGLGVGGLAFALAAQGTIENIIGGLALFADRPVRVGDFCKFGDQLGTVEEIGLRSTRIRTLDRTVVSVPNADFSKLQLENYNRRDNILIQTTLGLRYETTSEQLRFVLARLRELLLSHPKVLKAPLRVRLVGFGAYSLDIEVFAYVRSSDWSEFLAIREDLFLRMIDLIEEAGTGFAFPSETHYVTQDKGLGGERARDAERQVEAWRAEGTLPFPDFSEEHVRKLHDSIDFPPAGSPAGPPHEPAPPSAAAPVTEVPPATRKVGGES